MHGWMEDIICFPDAGYCEGVRGSGLRLSDGPLHKCCIYISKASWFTVASIYLADTISRILSIPVYVETQI